MFKTNFNSDFVLGRKPEGQVIREFFDMIDRNQDGKISYEEFRNYYIDVCSMIGGDKGFEDLIRSTWGEFQKQSELTQEQVNDYVNLIRERLVTMTKGVEDEFRLQQLYKSFDRHNSGMLSSTELDGLLLKLNIVIPKDVLPLLFKSLDKNRSGYIEFDEFCNFVLYNPYKR